MNTQNTNLGEPQRSQAGPTWNPEADIKVSISLPGALGAPVSQRGLFNERDIQLCVKVITLKSEHVQEMIKQQAPHFSPSQWKALSKRQKLIAHLELIAEGLPYTFNYID